MRDLTKKMFADTLIQLMETTPFEKISVQSICKKCEVPRQTFYYHFKDKYELVTWIYYNDVVKVMNESKNLPWEQVLLNNFIKLREKDSFYKEAFKDYGQNALIDYIHNHDVTIYVDMLKEKNIDAEKDKDLMFSIHYHAYACVHMTKHWLLHEPHVTPQMQTKRMIASIPTKLKEVCGIK